MYIFCRFLGILILVYQTKGEAVLDCNDLADGTSNNQNYCKKPLDHNVSKREATSQQSVPKEYICQSEGRFPDSSDSTCMKYFQCERLSNGTFIKKSLKCPNSTFCGSTQKCSILYTCPCDGTSETETSSESYKITTKSTVYPCFTSSETDFDCVTVGRFADLNDPLCETYFLCSHLYNGSFVKTKYKCRNSFFDPVIKKCSVTFPCPCAVTTISSTVPVTNPVSQYVTSTVVFTSASTSNAPSENVTSSSTMTTKGCTIDLTKDHICVKEGRFTDYSDLTCRKYFLCSKLRNGTFIKTPYECKNSSFNPLTLRCSTGYICPCIGDQTTLESTQSSEFSSTGRLTTLPPVTLTTEIVIPLTTDFLKTSEDSKATVTSPLHSSTSTFSTSSLNYSTTEPSGITTISPSSITSSLSSSSETPICKGSSDDFICSSAGRFPDLTDSICEKYFLCSLLRNGSFVKTNYRCPNSSRFYPPSKKCSTTYICPCGTSTSSTSTPQVTITSSLNPLTTENATIEMTSSSEFSSTVPTTSSSSTTGCTVSYNEFQCTITGRFPDFSDVTCRKYFLCSQLFNGTFIKTSYTCLNSTFNPLIFRCSVNYVCPCNAESTLVTTPIIDLTTTSEGFTKLSTTTVPTTTSYTCVAPSGNVPEYVCSSVGRFPDYSDITCRKYFLCSRLQNGTFIKTPYNCPVSSCITTNQRCSSTCICPCLL